MEPDFLVSGFEAIQAHQKDPPFDGFWRFDVEHPAPKNPGIIFNVWTGGHPFGTSGQQ